MTRQEALIAYITVALLAIAGVAIYEKRQQSATDQLPAFTKPSVYEPVIVPRLYIDL